MKHVLSIVTIMICSSLWADAQAQTIADMARRERAKKAASEKQTPQKKTAPITNSQLKPKAPTVTVIETGGSNEQTAPASAAASSAPGVTAPIASAAAAAAATAAPEPTPAATATVTTPPAPESATAASAAPATPAPPPPANEPPARDEKYWRQRFETARADVRRSENQVAVAELEFNAANRDFLQTS